MSSSEVHLELLLGSRVLTRDGAAVGRIEEICADERDGELVVTEYLLGAYAVLERLSVSAFARELLHLLHLRTGYRVPWETLDLSDPMCPRLTCSRAELEAMRARD